MFRCDTGGKFLHVTFSVWRAKQANWRAEYRGANFQYGVMESLDKSASVSAPSESANDVGAASLTLNNHESNGSKKRSNHHNFINVYMQLSCTNFKLCCRVDSQLDSSAQIYNLNKGLILYDSMRFCLSKLANESDQVPLNNTCIYLFKQAQSLRVCGIQQRKQAIFRWLVALYQKVYHCYCVAI